jgi:hypothetical protein
VPSYSELLKRVLDATAMDLRKTKGHNAEDRRVRWTKYKNISMRFDNWENDLVELGKAVRDPISSKVLIPEEQFKNIGNFDETCLSLDGSNNNRGGRPECVIYDPRFPLVGKATSKSALTTASLDGSNNNRGGRPECVIYDPRFPLVGKATSKSALTTASQSFGGKTRYQLHSIPP